MQGEEMRLLPDIDERLCKRNARQVLKKYRTLARIAGIPLFNIKSPAITGMPRTDSPFENTIEIKNAKAADAQKELNDINRALRNISNESFQVIYYCYISREEHSTIEISQIIFNTDNADKTVERRKSKGLIEFCEAYRHGELLMYKNIEGNVRES